MARFTRAELESFRDAEVPDLRLVGLALAAPVSDVTHFAQRAERRHAGPWGR